MIGFGFEAFYPRLTRKFFAEDFRWVHPDIRTVAQPRKHSGLRVQAPSRCANPNHAAGRRFYPPAQTPTPRFHRGPMNFGAGLKKRRFQVLSCFGIWITEAERELSQLAADSTVSAAADSGQSALRQIKTLPGFTLA